MKKANIFLPVALELLICGSLCCLNFSVFGKSQIYELNSTHYQEFVEDTFDNSHTFFGAELKSFAVVQTLEANQTISLSLDRVIFDSNASVWEISTEGNASLSFDSNYSSINDIHSYINSFSLNTVGIFNSPNIPPFDLNVTTPIIISESLPVGAIVAEFNATDVDGFSLTSNSNSGETLLSIDFKHDTKSTGVGLRVGDKISVNISGANYEYSISQADINAINGTVGDTLSNPQNYNAAALRMANGLAAVINAATATNQANVDLSSITSTATGAKLVVSPNQQGDDLAITGTGAVTISQAEVLPTATTFNFSLSDPARTLKTGDRIQIDRDGSMVTFNYNGGGATGFTSWNDLATKIGSHAWFQSATVAGNTMTVTATVEDINAQPNFRVRQIQTDDAGSVLTNPTHSGGTFVKQANWTNVGTTGGANSGLSLDLTVNNTNGQLSSVAINTSGNGYVEGDTLSIPAGQLDGTNSIQIRVDDVRGQINGISGGYTGRARDSYFYNGVNTSTITSPTGGSGAILDIVSDAGGNITSANIVGGGTLYAVGDEFTVATADIGGGDATLATFQVTGVNAGTGAATTVALVSGNAKSNNLFSGITSTSNGAGTGGTFNISTNNDGTISGIAFNGIGNNYRVGEEITIGAADLGGGTAADVKFTINALVAGTSTVNAVSYQSGTAKMSFTDNGVTATGGSGSGLALDITTDRLGAVSAVNVNSNGQNYTGSDTITVDGGTLSGGASGTDNLTFTIGNTSSDVESDWTNLYDSTAGGSQWKSTDTSNVAYDAAFGTQGAQRIAPPANAGMTDTPHLGGNQGTPSLSYSLVDGNGSVDNAFFNMEQNGTLRLAQKVDFETAAQMQIRVRVTDDENATLDGQFLVTVTDANDPPEGHLQLLGQVEVGQQVIIDHNISDQDGDGNLTFSWFQNGQPLTRAEVLDASTSQFSTVLLSSNDAQLYLTHPSGNSLRVYQRNMITGSLHSPSDLVEGANGVAGLINPRALAFTSNDSQLYVGNGYGGNAISWFDRNMSSGALSFGGVIRDGINGVDGLQSVNAMIFTNDDQFLYASGYDSDAVSWYERNASDGNLTFIGKIQDNTGGVNGLDGAGMMKLSSDESTLYVLGGVDSSISWFDRNSTSGALTYVGSVTDGAGGVDGLGAVTSFDLTTSGTQLYATSQHDNSIAWFDINSTTGALSFVGIFREGDNGISGLSASRGVQVADSNSRIYVLGEDSDNNTTLSIFDLNASSGAVTFVTSIEEGRDGVAGLTGAMSFLASADGKYLYVPATDNRLAILSIDQNNSTIETGFISDHNYTFRESDLDSNISVVAHYVDGAGNDENVTYTAPYPVIPPNDPPYDLNFTSPLYVLEGEPIGTVVADFNASDPDFNATITISLHDENNQTANHLFSIDANGTLHTAAVFDRELNASFQIKVRATDEHWEWIEQIFTVEVGNVNEPPVLSQNATISVVMDEDGYPYGWPSFTSTDFNATDPDGDDLNWSVKTYPTYGNATVDGIGNFPQNFYYLPHNDYNGTDTFVIQVSDGNLSVDLAFNVQVNSRPENNIIPLAKQLTYSLWPEFGQDFLFTGGGFTDEPDPVIYLIEGTKYYFEPQIQVDGLTIMIGTSVGTPYTGSELETEVLDRAIGTIAFTPDQNTPRNLKYYMVEDPNLSGDIVILDSRESKLYRPNLGTSSNFGFALSSYGAELLVGSYADDSYGYYGGLANIFTKDENGTWASENTYAPPSGIAQGWFGRDLSIFSNNLIVGAPSYTTFNNKGYAYIYERNGTSWMPPVELLPSDSSVNDRFGYSVSAAENLLAVGARDADGPVHLDEGAVYFFEKDGNGTWIEQSKLVPADSVALDRFGHSVSMQENRVIVGSLYAGNSLGARTGAAYIFSKVGNSWVQEAKLQPSDLNGTDFFGASVSLDGNFSYVGAPNNSRDGLTDNGAVYVFRKNLLGQWVEDAKLVPSLDQNKSFFGKSVSGKDGTLLIGSPGDNNNTRGRAFLFERDQVGNWNEIKVFTPEDGFVGDRYGQSVEVGASLFVGAPGRNDRGSNSGGVYAYDNPNWNDTPPVLSVQGQITVEMDEDGDPVAWNAPSLFASDMGGDLLTWGAFYENPSEANGTIIVSGVGSTPSVFNYIPRENFYGTDIFVVTVSDGIYEQNVEVRVVITSQPDEGEPLVRMMPGFGHSILYANAEQGQPITVWGAVSDGEAPFTYTLDCGDGTVLNGTVSDPKFIGSDHTYSTSGLKRAKLEVTDAFGNTGSAETLIRVFLPSEVTLDERRNMAFDRGLLFLYLNAVEDGRMNGLKWLNNSSSNLYTVAATGMGLMAFTDFGHTANTPFNEHTYGDIVRKTLRFLVGHEHAGTLNASNHSDGIAVRQSDDPAGHAPGKVAYLLKTGGHDSYSNSIAVMALLTAFPSGENADSVIIDHGPFNGWSYRQLAQECIELLMWSQGDGSVRGGWEYYLSQNQRRYDGSVQQWPVIALMTADEKWGIPVPNWVKDNVEYAYDYLTDGTGGVGYSRPSYWLNLAKTGGHLIADAWFERNATHAKVTPSLGFITDRWMNSESWAANLYSAYGIKKGLDFIGITTIQTPWGARDWDRDMSAWYLGIDVGFDAGMFPTKRTTEYAYGQKADGSWDGLYLGSRRYSPSYTTASVLALLSRGVTDFPPVPAANYPHAIPPGKEFRIDGSVSYHSDPSKSIRQWKWKWNWTGSSASIDWNQPDAVGPRPIHPGYSTNGTHSFALQVTDNGTPEESVVKEFTITVSGGNHNPIPVLVPVANLPNYSAGLNETVTLDAGASFDLDNYDSVTGYRWDLNGDGTFVDGNETMTIGPFSYPNQVRVGLKVNDETFSAWSDAVYADVFFSEADLSIVDVDVVPFNMDDSNFTLSAIVENNATSVGISRNQIVRFYDESPFTTGSLLGEAVLPDLSPGSQATANLTLPIEQWVPEIYILLDPYQRIQEWNETNNLGVFQVEPNYPPSDILLQPSGLAEEKYAGLLAGTLSAVDLDDPNNTGTYIYSMVSGEGDIDNQSFDLVGNQLFSKRAFDFEERSEYFVRLRVTDHKLGFFEKSVAVPIVDVDDHSPVLSLVGDAEVFHEAMTPYLDEGATWIDYTDANGTTGLSGTSSSVGVVNIALPGTYQVRFEAADLLGNQAVPIYRDITVRDTTKPTIFLRGGPEVLIEAAVPYEDQGAYWADTVDGYESIEANGTLDIYTPGVYTLTYGYTDTSGNVGDPVSRIVTVVDTTPATLTMSGQVEMQHPAHEPFIDPGVTFSDGVDGEGPVVASGEVDIDKPGAYQLTYSYVDSSGNPSNILSRTVYVVDQTPPVITLEGNESMVHGVFLDFLDPGATAIDGVDGNITHLIETTNEINLLQPGTFQIYYNVSDSAGNDAVTVVRQVVVTNQAPVDIALAKPSIDENAPSGTVVGSLVTIDPNDPGAVRPYSYVLLEHIGIPEPAFSLRTDGTLISLYPLDYEQMDPFQIRVRTTDEFGASFEKIVDIELADGFRPIVGVVNLWEWGETFAYFSSSIVDEGSASGVLEQGFLVSQYPDPTFFSSEVKILDATLTEENFTASIDTLLPGKNYYIRGFARNPEGTSLGPTTRITTAIAKASPHWSFASTYPEADGWWESPWFGVFYSPEGEGWLLHDNLGWLYALPADREQGVWLWIDPLGWLWTESTIYPFLFDNQRKDWLFYHGSLSGEMILYNYRRKEWEKVPNQSNSQN